MRVYDAFYEITTCKNTKFFFIILLMLEMLIFFPAPTTRVVINLTKTKMKKIETQSILPRNLESKHN